MSVERYFDHYRSNGFFFKRSILSRYCLSLFTKPFVILSGISGTGKTKIAQLFEPSVEPVAVAAQPAEFGYIIMNITQGVYNGDGRGNLKSRDLNAVFETDEVPDIERRIEELRTEGVGDNITEPEIFTVETDFGEFLISIYLQRASSPLLRVRFISKRGDATQYDSQQFLRQHYNLDDVLKLQKVGRRRLRVVGRNEADVIENSQIVETNERKNLKNKLFISVKSNWQDTTDLFGYYNVLESKYYVTPLLKFILLAKENPNEPFFLILDEMNLSRVEYYFSDFLSCIESRVYVGEDLRQENVQLHNFDSFVDSNDSYYDVIPKEVEIPMNLYVTGTVNIDETTFSFSPKVLDRANVIEFNEVSLDSYNADDFEETFVLKQMPKFAFAKIATSKEFIDAPATFKAVIKELLEILQPYNLHFGYRVINEMALFINNSVNYVGDDETTLNSAIDIQVSQKVLTKLNGAFGKLDEPVRKLIQYLIDEEVEMDNIDHIFLASTSSLNSKYPESLSKLIRLYKNLLNNGFASYLE